MSWKDKWGIHQEAILQDIQVRKGVCALAHNFYIWFGTAAKHVLVLSWFPSALVWFHEVFGNLRRESMSRDLLVQDHSLLSGNVQNSLLFSDCWPPASPTVSRGSSSSGSAWSSGAGRRGRGEVGGRPRGQWRQRRRWGGRWCEPPRTAPSPPASASRVLGQPSWSLAHWHPSYFPSQGCFCLANGNVMLAFLLGSTLLMLKKTGRSFSSYKINLKK